MSKLFKDSDQALLLKELKEKNEELRKELVEIKESLAWLKDRNKTLQDTVNYCSKYFSK